MQRFFKFCFQIRGSLTQEVILLNFFLLFLARPRFIFSIMLFSTTEHKWHFQLRNVHSRCAAPSQALKITFHVLYSKMDCRIRCYM